MDVPGRLVIAICAVVFTVVIAVAVGQAGEPPKVRTVEVRSEWDDVPMSCRTTQLELDGRDVEWFRCVSTHAGLEPPTGRYTDDGTIWYSDIDGRPAVHHDIEIAPTGVVVGWARYR